MSRNLALTFLGIILLTLTIGVLFWIRGSIDAQATQSLELAAQSFDVEILGDSSDLVVDFEEAEARATMVTLNPFVRRLVLAKRVGQGSADSDEGKLLPIVPFDLRLRYGESDWLQSDLLNDMTPVELRGKDGQAFGTLFIEPDRTTLRSIETAIIAVAIALGAALLLLLGQLYRQQTTIERVGGELERRKSEMIRLERLALAGELTSNLLHDLKKPVLSVRQRLQDWAEDNDETNVTDIEIANESERDLKLFFQMLSDTGLEKFVRSDRVSEEYVDVNQMIETSLRLVHYEKGDVNVEIDFSDDLPPILVHPYRLVQVFSNLILNAYQALKPIDGAELRVSTSAKDKGVVVRFEDNGNGISEDLQQSIFDPFFTTKSESEGTGLGLAISKLIVEELGGTITLESREGGPTVFTIRLPAD